EDIKSLSSRVGMGSNRHVDGLALLIVEVNSERPTEEKQSRVKSKTEEINEAAGTSTAADSWAWPISSLILIIFLLKKLIKSSLLRIAGMHGLTEL
ncbi:MAG: hypothetical protein AAFW00_28985, partial [Bacteroidota bacterium]